MLAAPSEKKTITCSTSGRPCATSSAWAFSIAVAYEVSPAALMQLIVETSC